MGSSRFNPPFQMERLIESMRWLASRRNHLPRQGFQPWQIDGRVPGGKNSPQPRRMKRLGRITAVPAASGLGVVVVLGLDHALAIGAGLRGHFALHDSRAASAEAKGGGDGEYDAEQFHERGLCQGVRSRCKQQMCGAKKGGDIAKPASSSGTKFAPQ